MSMPKPDQESRAFFASILPDDPRVQVRPMFGNVAGFVNGNMFAGLYGNDVFVRLADADRAGLLGEAGASVLEPMPGRPMKEYVVLPQAWRDRPERAREWVARSLAWTSGMPMKKAKRK